MRELQDEVGATVILFQDDDFPMFGPVWHRWTRSLLDRSVRMIWSGASCGK